MSVLKDFVRDCFVAQIRAKMCVRAGIRAYLRDEATPNKILGYEHWNYLKEHAYTPPGRATQVAGATQVARSTSIFFTKLWTYENI